VEQHQAQETTLTCCFSVGVLRPQQAHAIYEKKKGQNIKGNRVN
jgi:hypothetical protein